MLLNLEQLGKSFGEKIVLENVTASVEREDRIGIVGQNGAGKTTLLKILTGEYTDYTGEFSLTTASPWGTWLRTPNWTPPWTSMGRCARPLRRCWTPWPRCRCWSGRWPPAPATRLCWSSTPPCRQWWTPPTATTWM